MEATEEELKSRNHASMFMLNGIVERDKDPTDPCIMNQRGFKTQII